MANNGNLRPPFSPSEARENGKKGAAASAKARKAKKLAAKTYAEAIQKLLKQSYHTDLSTEDVKATCQAFGLDPTQSGAIALAFSDFFRALQGDESSMQRILNATSSLGGAEEKRDTFEPSQIYVLPSAKPGEEIVIEEGGEDADADP